MNNYKLFNISVQKRVTVCYLKSINDTFNSFEVMKKCQNNFNTLIHEALIMRHQDPLLNKQIF